MASGSASTNLTANSGGRFYVSVYWNETSTSTADNTSTIAVTGTLGQRASTETFWSGNIKAGQLAIWWHDDNVGADQWINSLNIWEIGYDQASRSVTGSITVSHKSDGTLAGYAFAIWTKDEAGTPYYAPNSGRAETDWVNLTTIPRASTPTITPSAITIPAVGTETFKITTNRASSSFTHDITIKSGATTIKTITGVGASTDVLVADIDDDVLATIPNAKTATLSVQCVTKSGSTNIGTKTVTMTANVSQDAAPTFTNYTYADTNATTTAITGDNSVMISGKSTLAVTISSANKAVANFDATMSKYTMAVANLYADENYSASSITKTLGSPEIASSELPSGTRDLVVSAIDSRGLSTAVTKPITIVPYESPIINATATRVNGFENDTKLKISGKFSRIEVNGTAKNTVNSSSGVKYRYKAQSTSTWGNWINKAVTVDTATGTITATDATISLDNQQAYDIEVQMTDKLETTTVSLVVSVGQPAFFIGTDGRVSVGEMPQQSKLTGEQGLFEVAGRAFANGNRLAELPITKDDMAANLIPEIKLLATVPYTSFGNSQSPYNLDVKTLFANNNADRIRYFDALLLVMNFQSTSSDTYLRIGSSTGVTDAAYRSMITVTANSTLECLFGDYPNLIVCSSNLMAETMVVTPVNIGVNQDDQNVDTAIQHVGVNHLWGVQLNGTSNRYNLGSALRLARTNGYVPMFFDPTRPTAGSMRVYGVRYQR